MERVVDGSQATNLDANRHETRPRGAHCITLGRQYNFHIFLKGIKPMKTAKARRADRLQEVENQFLGLSRTMSSLWGISPTMAEIHGLLYITGSALSMDDIIERLQISRGNVSMNLSKLVEWG